LGITILALGIWYYAEGQYILLSRQAGVQSGVVVGRPAPDFELDTLGGGRLRLSELRGQPVVLNFWATWCGPCRAEMPELEALSPKNSGFSFHSRLIFTAMLVVHIQS
jgi:thiol-disulfide isomerase/thioredoxin